MKKFILLSLIAVMTMVSKSFAQSSLIATLSHEGTISTFYGASALKNAYEAAADGDIITLSSGTFTAIDISKSLTIRGAGMEPNNVTGTIPTIISGDFNLGKGYNDKTYTFEGIYHNGTITGWSDYANFIKCRLKNIDRAYEYYYRGWKNYNFINCRITALLRVRSDGNGTPNPSVSCVNCIVMYPENDNHRKSGSFEFTNCIVCRGNWGGQDFYNATMKNCIYVENGLKAPIDASVNAYNTVFVCANKNDIDWLSNIHNNRNTFIEGYENLFSTYSTFTPEFPDNESFELTGTAQTSYLGLDGTQVGIYGGSLPFNPTVSGPQITRCNVASKSTADGKLSVDIEVSVNQ